VKIKLRFLGIKPREQWKEQVAKEIDALGKVAAVSSADVVLEGRRESGPFFRLRALLAVPGPDFHAEGVDHTFAAALRKLVQELTRQIRHRKEKRLSQRRPSVRNWTFSSGGFGSLAAGRR
jgi:ribosome-associated translation inhibitor RaiA